MSEFVGKYVCFTRMDGGCCWGRIREEAISNTMGGEKEVFILEDRWVRHNFGARRGSKPNVFFPDPTNDPTMYRVEGNHGFRVEKVRGVTTVRKEMLNLDTDIIDLSEIMNNASEELIMNLLLSDLEPESAESALEIGLRSLMASDDLIEKIKRRARQLDQEIREREQEQ